jgi:hypothetical protein
MIKMLRIIQQAEYPARYRRTHGPHTYADCCFARRQSIRTVVYPRVLNRQRRAVRQLLCVEDNARALAWLVTSNLASKNNTLSLSTLLCRRLHHASEVQQLFSTRYVSDVSWGKFRRLTEWRNTPGQPGCISRANVEKYNIVLGRELRYFPAWTSCRLGVVVRACYCFFLSMVSETVGSNPLWYVFLQIFYNYLCKYLDRIQSLCLNSQRRKMWRSVKFWSFVLA